MSQIDSQSSLKSLVFDSRLLQFEDLEAEPEEPPRPELDTESESISTETSISLLPSSAVSISKCFN